MIMAELYAKKIKEGKMTLDNVPPDLLEEVKKVLKQILK